MPGRRRLAVVATPLLGLLAAVVAGWSAVAAQEVSGDAGAGPLTLESATVTTITVTWDAVPGATRYDVRWRAPDGIFGPDQATTATRYEITGLSPGSPYVVRVHAIGANGARLQPFRGDFRTILTAPASLTLTTSTSTSLTVAWTAPAGWTPAGYRLNWRPVGPTAWQGSAQLAADSRTHTITGLADGTQYLVRLLALNGPGTESPPRRVTVATKKAGPTGARPLTLESATLTTLTVTWDAVPDAARYDVRWRAPDGVFGPDQAATATRYEITGLSPGRPYVVRVHPISAGGATLRQFRGDFRTILTAPATLTVSAASATSLTVNWSKPTGWTPAGYLLSWRPVGPTAWQASTQLAAGVRSHAITGLTDGTKYLVRLTALNPAGTESPPTRVTATAADAAAPLTVTLTSSRDICTANTLTDLTWTITGGKAPYHLSIDGEAVDRAAESHRINCGPIPETAAPDPAWEHLVEYRHARAFTATVTDARGVSATGTDLAELKEPLPAPTGIAAYPLHTSMGMQWDRVAAAGPVPALGSDCPCPLYVVRWRAEGSASWTSHLTRDRTSHTGQTLAGASLPDLREGTTYEVSIATLRDAIEHETPGALTWSAPTTAITWAPATGVRATATHDTITVTWDSQPATDVFEVSIFGSDGSASQFFRGDGSTPHEVAFHHLPPDTEYTVRVWVAALVEGPRTEITARTTAAPPGWTPLPRGPQNMRTTATHNSVTVDWDAPYAGAEDAYQVWIFHTGADREPTAQDRKEYILLEGAGITEHTFTGLARATTYVVYVEHPSIVSETVRVAVTTAGVPAPRAKRAVTCFEYLVGATICA